MKQQPNSYREKKTLIDLLFIESTSSLPPIKRYIPTISTQQSIKKSSQIIRSEQKLKTQEKEIKKKEKKNNIYSFNDLIVQNSERQNWEMEQLKVQQNKLLELLKPSIFMESKVKQRKKLLRGSQRNSQYVLPSLSNRNLSQNSSMITSRIQIRQSLPEIKKCKLCFGYIDNDNFQLNCKHNYHLDCLKEQINQLIKQGQQFINCISCNNKIDYKILRNILSRSTLELLFINQLKLIVQKYHSQINFQKCKKCFFFWIYQKGLLNTQFCQNCNQTNQCQ